ncbi:hypothetical protein NEF87_001714 [Candidatus Lokiarchaeum ossiferum]|uniref:Uncharacterized protein n=1 Tax=Candidatus Lokiarchaeum ossiferum TaxID=2951803 RepID=A0ABY6HPJ0_9ARCH|nr:hypothetical protein NEF87_001714 [Candidatus Lokiarchaeum sp. B-35]
MLDIKNIWLNLMVWIKIDFQISNENKFINKKDQGNGYTLISFGFSEKKESLD